MSGAKRRAISELMTRARSRTGRGPRSSCARRSSTTGSAASEAFAATIKTIPLGRAGTPEDVASVIAFLAGPDAAYLAGETIEINGGMNMR